jgi:hypothetical protein
MTMNRGGEQLQIMNGTVSLKFGGIGHKKLISRERLLKDEKAVNEGLHVRSIYATSTQSASSKMRHHLFFILKPIGIK